MNGVLVSEMINYYQYDIKRINHFMKVYAYAKSIGENEKLRKEDQNLLEISAIIHDIGIKISEEKYHSSSGKYQEIEGPSEARKMLKKLKYSSDIIDKVCYLVGNHHTYDKIDSISYQILVEADFLVNIEEDHLSKQQILKIEKRIFKTKTGIKYLNQLFNI